MVTGIEITGARVVALFGARDQAALGAAQTVAANDNGSLDPVKTVTVRKTLQKSGVAIKIKVPVDEFVGVAVSTTISEEGVLRSAIELMHEDQDLNYQVFEELGNGNVVAEWQNWGRKLRLPLFIKAGDGSFMAYSQQVDGLLLGKANTRRKALAESGRRPRFLTRRKPGAGEGA